MWTDQVQVRVRSRLGSGWFRSCQVRSRSRSRSGCTFISLSDASVSRETDVSQLPLRDEAPAREARVAADSVDAVLEP